MYNQSIDRKEFEAVVRELRRQKESKYDVIVSSDNLIALKDVDGTLKLEVPFVDESGNIISRDRYGITDFCHSQISAKTGIPYRYYQRMMDAGKINLLAQNINAWLPSKEKRLVRILDGKVRAVLSDRYRIIDNYDVLWKSIEEVNKVRSKYNIRVDIRDLRVTEQHLYLKITSPDLVGNINTKRHSGAVNGGIIISNSEVGAGAFYVKPFMTVLVCSNGLISENVFKKVHVGKERGIGLIDWSDETLQLEDLALWSKISDMIHATFNPEIFAQWVDRINGVATNEITKPQLAVDNIIKHFDLPQKKKEDILNQFFKEDDTQWGLAMAVTRIAHNEKDYEKAIELEHIGSRILELPIEVINGE